jgi:hypothetical protein
VRPDISFQPAASFRGQRDYFHSTDIYLALIELLGKSDVRPVSFDLKLRERIVTAPTFEAYVNQPPIESSQAAATARLTDVEGRHWQVLVRPGNSPISARKPYDENVIWSKTRRELDAFTVEGCEDVEPIEVVTAVGVLAHRTMFPPAQGKRWMLAQLQADRMLGPSELQFFRFELRRQLGRGTTQSVMTDLAGPFGKMLFILK